MGGSPRRGLQGLRHVSEPFIDADDIADVAVAALTDELHANKLYEVTGPRALTFAAAVDEIAKGLRRPIRFVQITPEDFIVSLRAYFPEDLVQLLHELFTVVLDGRNTQVMHGVTEALGRPPRDFSEYVRRTVASGVWGMPIDDTGRARAARDRTSQPRRLS